MEEANPCYDVSTPTQSILETNAAATFDALPTTIIFDISVIDKIVLGNNLLSICELV